MNHGPRTTLTGKLLNTSMELLKVELGLPGSPFHHDFKTFGHLAEHSWIKSVWQEWDELPFYIHKALPHLSLQREHDEFLMEAFYNAGFTHSKLR